MKFDDKYIGLRIVGIGFICALIGLLITVVGNPNGGWWFIVLGFWLGFVPGFLIHLIYTLTTVKNQIFK